MDVLDIYPLNTTGLSAFFIDFIIRLLYDFKQKTL